MLDFGVGVQSHGLTFELKPLCRRDLHPPKSIPRCVYLGFETKEQRDSLFTEMVAQAGKAPEGQVDRLTILVEMMTGAPIQKPEKAVFHLYKHVDGKPVEDTVTVVWGSE